MNAFKTQIQDGVLESDWGTTLGQDLGKDFFEEVMFELMGGRCEVEAFPTAFLA